MSNAEIEDFWTFIQTVPYGGDSGDDDWMS